MKNQHLPVHHHPTCVRTNPPSRLNTDPRLSVALITVVYAILLAASYNLGYLVGSSFTVEYITSFLISKSSPSQNTIPWSFEPTHKLADQCAEPISPELVRQTIIDQVYSGTSPYENFTLPRVASPMLRKDITERGLYEAIYKSLIQKVQPKTIIKFSGSLGISETYMAKLISQLGLETQILYLDDFHSWPTSRDLSEDIAVPHGDVALLNQFIQYTISLNATQTVIPVPVSPNFAYQKLCQWGIYGDLIEVDGGPDFHSAWLNINKAYKLLRPGGILFGHDYSSSYYNNGVMQAIRLFARVSNYRVKADEHHWMISSAFEQVKTD